MDTYICIAIYVYERGPQLVILDDVCAHGLEDLRPGLERRTGVAPARTREPLLGQTTPKSRVVHTHIDICIYVRIHV